MRDIDRKIQEALRAEDEELFGDGEQALLQMVADSFRGRMRGFVVLVFVAMTFGLALTIFTAIKFFQTDPEDTKAIIAWGLGFFFGLAAIGSMKIWYWMELNKNALIREVKRVELQLARLAKRVSGEGDSP